MRICKFGIPVAVAVIGIVFVVAGAMFIVQANSELNGIADEIPSLEVESIISEYEAVGFIYTATWDSSKPLEIDQVRTIYEQIRLSQIALAKIEEPKIQQEQATPSAMYNYFTAQRALLGLVKSKLEVIDCMRTVGIAGITIGACILFIGGILFKVNSGKA